jgi:hypothetical protein
MRKWSMKAYSCDIKATRIIQYSKMLRWKSERKYTDVYTHIKIELML